MESLSSVNTSFYSEILEGFAPQSTSAVPAVQAESVPQNSDSYRSTYAQDSVDLSNYYNEVKPEDILVKSGQYLVEASKNLDNTMVIAMQNGYSVQDVCNIKLAEQAHKAGAFVFKTANELSTFEIDV